MNEPRKRDQVWVFSGVNQKREPFVQVFLGDHLLYAMDPGPAREHALAILAAAEASQTDAIFFRFMREMVGLKDDAQIARILLDWRRMREEQTGQKTAATSPGDQPLPPAVPTV